MSGQLFGESYGDTAIVGIEGSPQDPLTLGDLRDLIARCEVAGVPDSAGIEALDSIGRSGVRTGHDLIAVRIRSQ